MKLFELTTGWTHVWYRNYLIYMRGWMIYFLPPFIQPVGLLLIMGLGVGHYVGEIDGMPYLVFVTAGILATESLLRATFECTYGSFYRMTYQHTFDAIISTPLTPLEVAFGEISWGATKSLISSVVLFIVMGLVGAFDHFWAVLAFPIIIIGGMNFAAVALSVAAKAKEFEHFQFFFAVIFPVVFLCGTYFPLNRFPESFQNVLWILPLTSVVDLTRAIITGDGTPWFLAKLAYLVISTILIIELALRLMYRRLIN